MYRGYRGLSGVLYRVLYSVLQGFYRVLVFTGFSFLQGFCFYRVRV